MYMNRHALRLRRQKETLWKTYKHSKDAIDFARFCRCRNKLRATTRSLRKELERKLLGEAKSDPKCFWKYDNSRLKIKKGVEDLQDAAGTLVNDDGRKAQLLNEVLHFSIHR